MRKFAKPNLAFDVLDFARGMRSTFVQKPANCRVLETGLSALGIKPGTFYRKLVVASSAGSVRINFDPQFKHTPEDTLELLYSAPRERTNIDDVR